MKMRWKFLRDLSGAMGTCYSMIMPIHRTRVSLVALAAILTAALSPIQGDTAQPVGRADFLKRLSDAAVERTRHTVRYDPAYVRIPYPGGDVPADTGVCSDEVIRVYRALGVDLQKEVHEDMARNF